MTYDGWVRYGDTEVINMARTTALAAALGITSVWQRHDSVKWIKDRFDPFVNYGDIVTAPWYDAGAPASTEFAGVIPMDIAGLEDSTGSAEVLEYVGDGGSTRAKRNGTLPLVFNVALVASTERGAEFGKRWLDRVLAAGGRTTREAPAARRRVNLTSAVNGSDHLAWSDGNTTRSIQPSGALRATKTTSQATFNLGWGIGSPSTIPAQGVKEADVVTVSLDTVSTVAGSRRLYVRYYNAANATITTVNGPLVAGAAGQVVRLSHTGPLPAGTVKVGFYWLSPSTPVDGYSEQSNVLMEVAPVDRGYFDGNMVGSFRGQFGWLGAANQSPSYRQFEPGTRARDLTYLRYGSLDAPVAHRQDVNLTRAVSVTRKRARIGSSTWTATFTLTCDDAYEYGEEMFKVSSLGGAVATGPGVTSQGTLVLAHTACPAYDYSPFQDPMYPALVPAPAPPDFLPDGWDLFPGQGFQRSWARITGVEPSMLHSVPLFRVTSTVEARMLRFAIWPSDSPNDDQCDPLFSCWLTYLPPNLPIFIDGERKVSYAWDGASPVLRRTDSLIFGDDATPLRWSSFPDNNELLVTFDAFAIPTGGYQGSGNVRASVSLMPKSD